MLIALRSGSSTSAVSIGASSEASSSRLDRQRRADVGLLAGFRHRVADDVRDLLLGRARRERELLVVARAPVGVGQDAARMIDEAQRLLDVALAVARLRVVLADQPAQRGPHVLVGGGGRDAERFVQRGFHGRGATSVTASGMPLESWWKSLPVARRGSKKRTIGGDCMEVLRSRPECAVLGSSGRNAAQAHDSCRGNAPARSDERCARDALPPAKSGSREPLPSGWSDASLRRAPRGTRYSLLTCLSAPATRGSRASRGSAPTCPSGRAGSRASRAGRRPCA